MVNEDGRWPTEGRLEYMRKALGPGGVAVDPVPITAGEDVTVLYHGHLAEGGTGKVWLHAGYGHADNWQAVADHPMEKTGWGWVKKFRVNDASRLNFCFRDDANRWDNNNGVNWSFEIHRGGLY